MELSYEEQRDDDSTLFQSVVLRSDKHILEKMGINWSASREGQIGWGGD